MKSQKYFKQEKIEIKEGTLIYSFTLSNIQAAAYFIKISFKTFILGLKYLLK